MMMYAALLPHQSGAGKLKPSDVLDLPWRRTGDEPAKLTEQEKAIREEQRKAKHAKWDAQMKKKTNG